MTSLRTIFRGTGILLVLCAGMNAKASDSPCFKILNYDFEVTPAVLSTFSNVMECETSAGPTNNVWKACFSKVLAPDSQNPEFLGEYRLRQYSPDIVGMVTNEARFPGQVQDYGSSPESITFSEKFSHGGFAGFWPTGGVWSDSNETGSGRNEIIVDNINNTITTNLYENHALIFSSLTKSVKYECRRVQ